MNKNDKWESAEETKVGWLEWFPIRDGNGIMLAPMCKGDGDDKCFTSSNNNQCDHNVTTIELDEVGDYVVFPSRFYHRGYYRIASNKTYHTAQLFWKVLGNHDALPNVTRKVNQNMIQGCVKESRLTQLTQDIRNNWDTTYSVNVFLLAKAFDSDKINATKNRLIPSVMFQGIPLIAELVKYFQDKYTHLKVCSVWLIEKLRENDGFQGWHRDFYLGIEVTTTIVVNVGAVTKNSSFVRNNDVGKLHC
jgi:hypothetical protein